MGESKNESSLSQPPAQAGTAPLYEALGGVLQRLLVQKFGVPLEAAESLVYEVFIVFYGLEAPPRDAETWLTAAACTSARSYLQRHGLPAADVDRDDEREIVALLLHRDALTTLTRRAREALRLRFAERKTYAEIAEELGVSAYAAEHLVAKAFAKLRGLRRRHSEE